VVGWGGGGGRTKGDYFCHPEQLAFLSSKLSSQVTQTQEKGERLKAPRGSMKKGGLGPWKNVEEETIENVVLKHIQAKGCMHGANIRGRGKTGYVVFTYICP
jgi:hypothetical protein